MNSDKKAHEHNGLTFHADRIHAERMAHELSAATVRHCERAVSGILAVPVALALGTAATALYASTLIGRTFELFEGAVVDVGRRLGREVDAARVEAWGRESERMNDAHA